MKKVKLIYFLLFIPVIASCQSKYVSDEEFNEKITWLEPHEIYLQLVDVYKKIPGVKTTYAWEVDGLLYVDPPMLLASQVKYIEVVNNILQSNICQCNLIVKTFVTEKEFNSRKNILNRLNKNRVKKTKNKKKKN